MSKKIVGAVLVAVITNMACAAENGSSQAAVAFSIDGQSYFDLPPPGGSYLINYTGHFKSSNLVGNDGKTSLPGASVSGTYNVFRLSYFPKTEILGAEWRAFEIFPTIVRSEFSFNGQTQRETGLADLAIDPFGLAWRYGKGIIGFSTTLVLPTAKYDQNKAANLGKNYASWMPQFFYTRHLDNNWGDLSVHSGYEYNFANSEGLRTFSNPTGAKYHSGQMVHTEIALSKYIGNWRLAANVVGGYQFTRDRIKGNDQSDTFLREQLDGNKYRKVGFGLSAVYLVKGYIPVTLSYTKDVSARNTAKGNSIVLRLIAPLAM